MDRTDPASLSARALRLVTGLLLVAGGLAVTFSAVLLVRSLAGAGEIDVAVRLGEDSTYEQAQSYLSRTNDSYATPAALTAGNDGFTLTAPGPHRVDLVLENGGAILTGSAVGVGALLLRPLLVSVAAGRPFGSGNARRLQLLGAVTAVTAFAGPLLPQLATMLTLGRLDRIEPDSPFVAGITFDLLPLLLPLVFLVLAEAFRQGDRLHRDTEGLV
ncbi:DUF2975 domain-containing protein [Kineosporia sp. J2-2]|uniref:DUF2975 domain-containing protein n=1 Tax=Kineosporia corallincola TaxID=2835133 RepID=A0ABS5TLB3_9ACTN|nr:DUF2975 domain-containing protein [Kineosporia corallincola]MBT0771876.1 DUF2975 domain-containing protein [Kineosporia corallincola]